MIIDFKGIALLFCYLKGFVLEKIMGQGGSSTVYQATDLKTNDKVAIKMIRRDRSYNDDEKGAKILDNEHNTMKLIEGHPNTAEL